jgi:putative membrane protein insertion efficiency factor
VRWRFNPLQVLLICGVRAYQSTISPLLPRSCKYYPSCSEYAVEAVRTFGVFRGAVLAGWRLLRCNPLSYGGYDPVERQGVFRQHSSAGTASRATGGA